MHKRRLLAPIFIGSCAALAAFGVQAQTTEQPFGGKRAINIYIGYTPGGSYDLYGKMVAQHLGRHLPGTPAVIANNMPGAGSLTAANYVYEVAPKDGTALALVSETAAMEQALGNPAVRYDATKFTWIGRVASSNNIHLVWHTAKAQSVEDAKKTEMTVAGTGTANLAEAVPTLLNALIGTKFKVITGYAASGPAMLAMERGEVDGAGTSWAGVRATKQDWLKNKLVKIIIQDVPVRDRELPDVPALPEFGQTPEDKQLLGLYASGGAIGRAIFGPPGIPPQTVAALRQGFVAMVKDPAFLADLQKANLDVEPETPESLASVVTATVQIPDSVRARVRSIFKN
jgi:tripartite-type tricarboxylate transporter receptor subunit TctC